jgi:hypothetical protein
MSTLSYLVGVAEGLGYDTATDQRQNRGVVIIPQTFSVNRVYGDKLRITAWRCTLTLLGATVSDGTAFVSLEALNDGFEADQSADGSAGSVSVSQWDTLTIDKGLITFQATITVEE